MYTQLNVSSEKAQEDRNFTLNPTTSSEIDHICSKLDYLRFVCVLCVDKLKLGDDFTEKLNNSSFSFLSPEQIQAHIEFHHKYEYQIMSPNQPLLKRGIGRTNFVTSPISHAIRLVVLNRLDLEWRQPQQQQEESLTKRYIERTILRVHQQNLNYAQLKLDIMQYCDMQEKRIVDQFKEFFHYLPEKEIV